jgi:phosphoglycolate phosphatase
MKTLALFDIDKTLIEGSKAHENAFSEAFKKVYGIDTTIAIINSQGMTDQQIIIKVLKKNGIEEKKIKSKISICMKEMIRFYNQGAKKDKIHILEGVRELLNVLQKHNVLMGLVTGNLESIAIGKLKKVGINHYFKVGGFGSDHINKKELVKIVIKRAIEQADFKKDNNVFLFGDTPIDIIAGRKAHVKTIGVATGDYSKSELKSAGADLVFENLRDKEKILRILLK